MFFRGHTKIRAMADPSVIANGLNYTAAIVLAVEPAACLGVAFEMRYPM